MAAHPEVKTMNEEAIFLEALQKPTPEARAAFLDVACADHPELRRSVNLLLKAHEQAGRFLENVPDLGLATIDEPSITERPGTVIGPYKLLEQIGEGGFGVVFMAEQQQPIRRKVALKVLKPGMDTRQVVARFEAERQALALMDHPNIARVIEGGETASARPFFVMELVKGIPITEFCDQHHLPVRDRLELFIHVCQAVQHAHQKGIIHRDLKPTNVMVTLHDDKPVVKVIDFGIAKAMGQQLTDKTLFTNFAQLIGTPLYMSPEQAQMSGLDVDTRSDIYSLGVLLYELLTGTPPFDKDRFKEAAYDEIRRIIREEEPPKPSTRISTLGRSGLPSRTSPARQAGPTADPITTHLATIAAHRKSDPKRLSQLFRGELDWIVMNCLEKDRNRRYDTAAAVAADVERYLHDDPVQACPPSTWYRFRKLTRRYRAALATASLLLLVLVAGVVVSTWQAIRASQALGQVKEQRDKAEANFRKACQAVDDEFTLVSQNKLLEAPGLQYLRKDLLESALNYYQEFLRQRPDDPVLQIEVAAAYFRLYLIYNAIGGIGTNAIGALEKGVEIVEMLLREHPDNAELYKRLAGFAQVSRDLHSVRGPIADPVVALAVFERATTIWKHFVQVYPTEPGFQLDLSEFYVYTYQSQYDALQYPEALASLRKAHAIAEKLARENPKVAEYRVELAFTHQHLGERLLDDGPPEEVEKHYRLYLELSQKLGDESPKVPQYRAMVADGHHHLGHWLIATDRLPEAEQAWRKALILQQKLVTEFPYMPGYQGELATYQYTMGILLRDSGRADKAEEAYRQAVAIWNKLAEDFPAWPEYRGEGRAFASFDLCLLLAASGRRPEAEQVYRNVLEFRPEVPHAQNQLAWLLANCSDSAFRDPSRALELAKKALDHLPNDGNIWNTLGVVHYRMGNWRDALAALEKSMQLRKGGDSYDWFFLAMAHWQLGDMEQARQWYGRAVKGMDRPRNEGDRQEFRRFHAEAAELLGIKDQPTGKEKEKPHAKAPSR